LKPSQWAWRLRRKAVSLNPFHRVSPTPSHDLSFDPVGFPFPPLAHNFSEDNPQTLDELSRGAFTFLNQTKNLGLPQTDWMLGPRREDRLWAVTLHYHGWAYVLAQREPELFAALVSDWIERCGLEQPGAQALAWNPYAVATRIGWWCRSWAALGPEFWRQRIEFKNFFLESLWRQANYLSQNVEWDLRANHLLRDGLGLAWAGRFFKAGDDSLAQKWLSQSAEIFRGQLGEQVLADGGFFERSPMYHLQAMEDLLQAFLLLEDGALRESIRETWGRMAEFTAWTRHPDGGIPLLNDSAFNGAQAPGRILAEGGAAMGLFPEAGPRRGLRHFEDTGLVIWQEESCSVFFDVGPLGPDEQPGHGHADNLTFELSWEGERLFVDPGAYAYDEDDRRALDRSTASHNTVRIDGMDSSEVWKIFRVGRRAKPRDVEVMALSDGFKARAAHDGYDHLPGKPCHFRQIKLGKNLFRLNDEVAGSGEHFLSGGFLLAPGWEGSAGDKGWEMRGKNKALFFHLQGPSGLKWSVEKALYHPQFGMEIPVSRLVWDWKGPLPFSAEFILSDKV
jgi:uncharacterized heparinase superfamily protein